MHRNILCIILYSWKHIYTYIYIYIHILYIFKVFHSALYLIFDMSCMGTVDRFLFLKFALHQDK